MSIKVKNKHRLKRKKAKNIISSLEGYFQESFSIPVDTLDVGEVDDFTLYFINEKPLLMAYKDTVLFTIQGLLVYKPKHRYVRVDMGAVRFVTNGADVMAPGIVAADPTISTGDFVWICDETHKKPLATGIALMSGEEMVRASKGKSVQLIHHIGDALWNSFQDSS